MIYSGEILYVLLGAIVVLFWWKKRHLSFDELLERNVRDHHHVYRVHLKHPRGGTWKEHKQWMAEEQQDSGG